MPHTPGPWRWIEGWGSDDIITGILDSSDNMVVDPLDGDGDPAFRCNPADIRLIAQAPVMYGLLKELEYCSGQYDPVAFCMKCGAGKGDPHSPACRLAAVLKAVEGE